MVVADGAAGRQAEPDGRRRLRAIPRVEHDVFLVDDAALVSCHVASVEAAGNSVVEDLIGRGVGAVVAHEVAGQLQDRELVERHVAVEGVDHPLPVGPHLAVVVEVDAVGVGVAGVVEPVAAAVLAPFEAGKQRVDEPVIRVRMRIGHEGVDDGRLRGQTGDVEREPAGKHAAIGLGGRREPLGFQPRENEPVDRIPYPRLIFDRRWLGPLGRDERPVRLVLRPLGDPAFEQFLLLAREHLLQARRRHHLLGIVGEDAVEHDARIGIARGDGTRLDGGIPLIEPEIGLATAAVGPVAGEAVLHEDGADVLVEGR